MESCEKLKVIARHGIGVNNLDLDVAKERNIVVTATPHANTNAVTEHAMMLICALSKNVLFFDKAVRRGEFHLRDQFLTNELSGKELSIFGCGHIGKLLAQKAALGFGMKVTCYDPYIDKDSLPEYISWCGDIEEATARGDVVSLHLPALENTHKMVNAEFLARMKPQAYLVNVARGELVDEAALADALLAGRLVDVYDPDPPQKNSPLITCPNIILTPHNAALSKEAVKAVMLGVDRVTAHMRSGSIFVDMSSINPVASKEIAAVLEEKGIEMLDAPVSGGEPKAIDGTLYFMVGGNQEIFEKVKPVLESMGASVVLCGSVGAGNTTKLANQIIVACNIQALSEALILAKKAGVDPELVFQAIKGGLAGSTVMNAKAPMMIEGNDKPGFKIDLHIKDLNNALDCAHTVGAPVPMTAAVQEAFQWLHSNGCGQDDHSSIVKYYKMLTDMEWCRPVIGRKETNEHRFYQGRHRSHHHPH